MRCEALRAGVAYRWRLPAQSARTRVRSAAFKTRCRFCRGPVKRARCRDGRVAEGEWLPSATTPPTLLVTGLVAAAADTEGAGAEPGAGAGAGTGSGSGSGGVTASADCSSSSSSSAAATAAAVPPLSSLTLVDTLAPGRGKKPAGSSAPSSSAAATAATAGGAGTASTPKFACALCGVQFKGLKEVNSHNSSKWHKFNMKRKAKGRAIVDVALFESNSEEDLDEFF